MRRLHAFFEKRSVQILTLLLFLAGMVYYWGWIFKFGYKFDWSVLYSVNKTYGVVLGLGLLHGLKLTVEISLLSSVFALVLGTIFGLGRVSSFRPFRALATFYVEFFRNTPLLVQLFFWYFALPQALPDTIKDWIFSHNFEFLTATTALSVYTGSFMAEVIRAGLQSIHRGLLEAAYSSGLTYMQVLSRIILPLTFRTIIPPLGSEFLNNMKNSSLAMVVGVSELCWQSQQIQALTFRGFEATTAATVIYLSLSLGISAILNMVNLKLRSETVQHRTIAHRTADFCFAPFGWLCRLLALPGRWQRRRARARMELELHYSSVQAAWHRLFRLAWRGGKTLLKLLFLLAMLYLLYRVVLGLAGFNWQVIWDNLGTLLIWRFPNGSPNEVLWGLGGLSFSIIMAVIAISVSFFIGLAIGLGRMSKNLIIRIPCTMYIEIIRGNPLIMVIFWVYFFSPILLNIHPEVFWSATSALTIFTGAYIAEIVRGGIQNIPRGQFEAAYSTGLTYFQTMRRIILPQALKLMIPAIVGQFIAIFKDTSLAFVIGVLELTFVAQGLNNRLMIYPFEIYSTIAALYFIGCYSMSLLARRLERRLSPETVRLQL